MSSLFKKINKKCGFTLTEILVVVLVVAILAALAYPLYTKAVRKTKAVEAINLLEMVRNKQISKFARDKQYYTGVAGLGQLTTKKNQEAVSGQVLKINDYTISLNAAKNCVTAAYDKGGTKFSFSSSYVNTGLGCTGDICTSFGNIIGAAGDVCNCSGSPECTNNFVRNEETCVCECHLGCVSGGTCFAPTQTQNTSRTCGNNGTQVRTCTASCEGGSCGEWGPCTGQTCPAASKPAASESCGNCGTRTRTVSCDGNTGNWTTTSWGSCTGQGVCAPDATQGCGSGGTQTCNSSCQWSTCVEPACPATCSDGFIRTSATTGNFATCCSCPSPKTTKMQSGGCDVNGNCQADKMICACPNTADYTKCTSTGGTWTDATCSCTCPTTGKNPFDSTTGCACPANKAWLNWRFTSGPGAGPTAKQCICSNAIDYSAGAGGACSNSVSTSNDMEARCKGLFCQKDCGSTCVFLSASAAASIPAYTSIAQQTAAGTWNSTTCSCSCPAGGTLSDGRCFMCTSPLVWNGSSCTCQLNCAQGYGTLDNYGYNTNAIRASSGCSCVCQTGQTWDYHGVTQLGQQVRTCAAPALSCSGSSTQTCGKCGTQTRVCNTTTGQWGAWGTCTGETGTCTPGATQSCNGSGTQTCSSSCTWGTCSNYCDDSNIPINTQTCGTCGRQYRVVSCNISTGQWTTTAWQTCMECPTGYYAKVSGTVIACEQCTNAPANASYTGCSRESTCPWACNSGYTQSGNTCVAATCPDGTKPATSQACGNCNIGSQTRTVTCVSGSWTTGSWGACSGGGTCTPGQTQSCGSGGTQTCSSSCIWGTCIVPINPVIKTTDAIASCNSVSGGSCLSYSYQLCQPGSGGWSWPVGYNPDDCRSRTTQPVCYNDYIQGTADQFSCTTWSLPNCSGSNYQTICNTNGRGYKCKISASGGTGNATTACMCEWYSYGPYSGYCDQASGLSCVTVYFDSQGSGTYLSCE